MDALRVDSSKSRGAVVIRRRPQLPGSPHGQHPLESVGTSGTSSLTPRGHLPSGNIEVPPSTSGPTVSIPLRSRVIQRNSRNNGNAYTEVSVTPQESDPPPFLDTKPLEAQSWLKVSDVLWGAGLDKSSSPNVRNDSTTGSNPLFSSESMDGRISFPGKGKEPTKEEETPKWLRSCTEPPPPVEVAAGGLPEPPRLTVPVLSSPCSPLPGCSPSSASEGNVNRSFGVVVESLGSSRSVSPREISPAASGAPSSPFSAMSSQDRRHLSYAARHGRPMSGISASGLAQFRYGLTTSPPPASIHNTLSKNTGQQLGVVPMGSSPPYLGSMYLSDSPGRENNETFSIPSLRAPPNILQRTTSYRDEIRTPRRAGEASSVCWTRSTTPAEGGEGTSHSHYRGILEIFPELPETMVLARERVFVPECDGDRKLGKGQFGDVVLGELYPPIEVSDNLSFFSPTSSHMQVLIPADPAMDSNVSSRMATPQRTRGDMELQDMLPVHQQRYTGSSKAFYHSGVSQNGSLLLSQSFSTTNLDATLNRTSHKARTGGGGGAAGHGGQPEVLDEPQSSKAEMRESSLDISLHSFEDGDAPHVSNQYEPLGAPVQAQGSRGRQQRASSWDSITSIKNPLLSDIASVTVEHHKMRTESPPADVFSPLGSKNRRDAKRSLRGSPLRREQPEGSPNSLLLEDLDDGSSSGRKEDLLRPSEYTVPHLEGPASPVHSAGGSRGSCKSPVKADGTPRRRHTVVEELPPNPIAIHNSNNFLAAITTGHFANNLPYPLSNTARKHSFKEMQNVVLTPSTGNGSSDAGKTVDSESESTLHGGGISLTKTSDANHNITPDPMPLELFEKVLFSNTAVKDAVFSNHNAGSPKQEDQRRPLSQQNFRKDNGLGPFSAAANTARSDELKHALEPLPSENLGGGEEEGPPQTVEFALPFRSVAVKNVCKLDLNQPKRRRELLNEIRMASHLCHKALVNWFGVSEDRTDVLLVMDLAEKGNLEQYIKKFGVGHTREMAPRFMADLVLALEYLRDGEQHPYNPGDKFGAGAAGIRGTSSPLYSSVETGSPSGSPSSNRSNGPLSSDGSIILHRDLKPENLLLTWDYHIKIADFGSSCFLGDTEAVTRFAGTAPYISPEIIIETRTSKYSDLWSAGCILYQMVEGKGPFNCKTDFFSMQKIKTFKQESLEFSPEVSSEAKDLILQLLQRKPEDRLGSEERGGFAALKKHPFFKDIDWENVLDTSNLTTKNQEYDVKNLAQHIGPEEVVLYNALVVPLDDPRFKQPVLLVLTDAPRLFIVDPQSNEHILDLHWSKRIQVTVECAETFRLEEHGRTVYRFRDECRRADLWAERIAILSGRKRDGGRSRHHRKGKKKAFKRRDTEERGLEIIKTTTTKKRINLDTDKNDNDKNKGIYGTESGVDRVEKMTKMIRKYEYP
eukprot:gene9353-6576_t